MVPAFNKRGVFDSQQCPYIYLVNNVKDIVIFIAWKNVYQSYLQKKNHFCRKPKIENTNF